MDTNNDSDEQGQQPKPRAKYASLTDLPERVQALLLDALAELADAWGEASGEEVVIQPRQKQSLDDWSYEFTNQIKDLGLNPRISNQLCRDAEIVAKTWLGYDDVKREAIYEHHEPRIKNYRNFAPHGKPMQFDEWCKWMLVNESKWNLKNIGKKYGAELRQTLQRHLNEKHLP